MVSCSQPDANRGGLLVDSNIDVISSRGFEIEDGWIKSDEEIWDEYLKRDEIWR